MGYKWLFLFHNLKNFILINDLTIMKWVICSNCKYVKHNAEPGTYKCPSCEQNVPFFKFEAFCGSKPGKIYDRN